MPEYLINNVIYWQGNLEAYYKHSFLKAGIARGIDSQRQATLEAAILKGFGTNGRQT